MIALNVLKKSVLPNEDELLRGVFLSQDHFSDFRDRRS